MELLTALQDNWSILVSIVGLIWSYANLKWHVWQLHTRVIEHEEHDKEKWERNEKEHCAMQKGIADMQPIFMEIRERLVKIETMLVQYKPSNRK